MTSKLLAPFSQLSAPIRHLLLAIWSLTFISGAIGGYAQAHHYTEPAWSDIGSTLLILVLVLAWYHTDSNERKFRRSALLTMLIIGMAIVGIPYYLIRSRQKGKRLIALGWLAGFTLIMFALSYAGEYIAATIL